MFIYKVVLYMHWERLTVSGDTFGCPSWEGEGGATVIYWVEARPLLHSLQRTRQPCGEELSGPKYQCAEAERPCHRHSHGG